MTTYNEIATTADRRFQAMCRRELGEDLYITLVTIASKEFQKGLKEPNENKRENTARRMANMVFTKALMKKV